MPEDIPKTDSIIEEEKVFEKTEVEAASPKKK